MKKKMPKTRNRLALNARQRTGAGPHKNKTKDKLRKICRQKVQVED